MIPLDKDEHIIFAVHKHWFVLVAEAFFLLFLVVFPALAYIALSYTGALELIAIEGDVLFLLISLFSAWLLALWVTFFVIWTDYYLDILILTNRKIIDVEQKGMFSREVSTFRLERVQDITVEVAGIIPTLLGFGKIHVQTAGEQQDFIVNGVPRPYKTKNQILSAIKDSLDRHRAGGL